MIKPHPELPGIIEGWFVTTLIKTPAQSRRPNSPKLLLRDIRQAGNVEFSVHRDKQT